MPLRDLTKDDQLVARRCVEVVLSSAVIPDEQYPLRIGVSRSALEGILQGWPPTGDELELSDDFFAVNNCLAFVAHEPLIEVELLDAVTREQADRVYERWIGSVGLPDPLAGLREKP